MTILEYCCAHAFSGNDSLAVKKCAFWFSPSQSPKPDVSSFSWSVMCKQELEKVVF